MRFLALLATISLTACATGSSEPDRAQTREIVRIVAPDLEEYGPQFQDRMADEIEALAPAECPRTGEMPPSCSALLTFTLDSVRLRDQLRRD